MVAIALLGLLASSVVFFRGVPLFFRSPALGSLRTSPSAAAPIAAETTAPDANTASVRPAAMAAPDEAPALLPINGIAGSAAAEIDLPESPTGDYELNLTAEQIGAIVEKRYGGLFPSLRLPPEQLARLRDLLGERQQATVEAANAALQTGLNPGRDFSVILSAIEQVQAAADATLRNELGETVLAACRDFDRTLCERNSVGDFVRLTAMTGEALSPDQQKQLVLILKDAPAPIAAEDMDRTIFGGINTRARISDQALARAATLLPSRQMELLRELQRSWADEDAGRQRSGRQSL